MTYCSDIDEAQTLAKKLFPDLADVEFEIPPQGKQNFVLIHDQDVIRIARHEWAAKSMPRESEILGLLHNSSPVPIPQFLDLYQDVNIMRITRVAGRHLSAKEINQLSQRQIQNITEQLAEFVAYLHDGLMLTDEQKAKFQDDTSYFHRSVFPRIEALLKQNLPHDQRQLLEKAKRYIETYNSLSDDIVLTHGDLMFGNILYDDKTGNISIVDFSGTSMGYRHLDFKKMLIYPKQFLENVLKIYQKKANHDVDIDLIKTAYCLNSVYSWNPGDMPNLYIHAP